MAKVVGVGGIFFKAPDPKALNAWYERVLGFHLESWGGAIFKPLPYGMTVWSAFPEATKHFAPSSLPFMVNLMVDDMDGMLAKVRAEGVEVLKQEDDDTGRFAWILDPAGVKIELWQPKPEHGGLVPGAA